MADYDNDLKNQQAKLIRKALKGSLFLAPDSAAPISTLTTTSANGPVLTALPPVWDDAGLLSGDGVSTASEQSSSDVTSWGYTSPTRSDVTTDTTSLTVVMQETKALTLGIYTAQDMAAIQAAAGTGEVRIDKPARPKTRHYRGLLLAVDESEDGEIFIAKYFPRIKVNAKADQTFGGGDEPISYGVTFQTFVDDAVGYSESWLFGGAGWLAQLEDMGFTQAAAV